MRTLILTTIRSTSVRLSPVGAGGLKSLAGMVEAARPVVNSGISSGFLSCPLEIARNFTENVPLPQIRSNKLFQEGAIHMAATAKPATKSEILAGVAETTGLSRKQVASVLDSIAAHIKQALGKKGPGIFALPGLFKITVVHKPAKAAYKGIDPFTKVERMFKAKPASRRVKVRPLKNLKDMVK